LGGVNRKKGVGGRREARLHREEGARGKKKKTDCLGMRKRAQNSKTMRNQTLATLKKNNTVAPTALRVPKGKAERTQAGIMRVEYNSTRKYDIRGGQRKRGGKIEIMKRKCTGKQGNKHKKRRS